MNYTEILGYVAATCTTTAFIPQAYKIYKTQHTKDISLGMFVLLISGVVAWLIYGIIIKSNPIIAANTITLVLDLYIIYTKIKLDGLRRQS